MKAKTRKNPNRVPFYLSEMDRLGAENAKRRECPFCTLLIHPDTRAHHLAIVHDIEEA